MNKTIILTCFILAACAGPPLHKPGTGSAEATKDHMECELQGAQMASGYGFNGNILIIEDYKARCLRGRGWR